MKNLFVVFFLPFLLSCEKPVEESLRKKVLETIVIYYTDINILVDTHSNSIYYYCLHKDCKPLNYCGFGDNLNYPPWNNLQPERLLKINIDDLYPLLKQYKKRINDISLVSDDMNNPEFIKTWYYLNLTWWGNVESRKPSEEENVVLEYKRSGKHYDASKIQWKNPNLTKQFN